MAVVCLRCGCSHDLSSSALRCVKESECPRCGYVGWTAAPNGARVQPRYDRSIARRLGLRL